VTAVRKYVGGRNPPVSQLEASFVAVIGYFVR
jgi:hypothetical protein